MSEVVFETQDIDASEIKVEDQRECASDA